jgi:hypothetical protein
MIQFKASLVEGFALGKIGIRVSYHRKRVIQPSVHDAIRLLSGVPWCPLQPPKFTGKPGLFPLQKQIRANGR